jgi:YidC/Oxa1 family membrane protein insertase
MKFEKNSVIGIVLLGILLLGYFYFTRQAQIQLEVTQKKMRDSLALIATTTKDTVALSQKTDSIPLVIAVPGSLQQMGVGKETFTTLDNELVSITFSSKGGQPRSVRLKKYQSGDSTDVILSSNEFNKISYLINTANNQTANTADLIFSASEIIKLEDGSSSIKFSLADSAGRSIEHRYRLKKDDYMFEWDLVVNGADKLFTGNAVNLLWQVQANQQERDIQSEKRETQLGLMGADGFDYFTMSDGLNKNWEEGLKWIGVKQKFFNTTTCILS